MKRPTMFIERDGIVLRVTQLLKEEFEQVTGLKMFTNGVIICESEIQPFVYHNETYLNPKPSNLTTASSIGDILHEGWTAASRELIEKRNIRHGWWADDFKKNQMKEISRSKMTVLPKQSYGNAYYELVVLQWWDGTIYECREKWRDLNGLACSSKSYRLKDGNDWQTWKAFKESNLQPKPKKSATKFNDQPKLF